MPKQRRPAPPSNEVTLDMFARQVEQALEHYSAPEWLGVHSPLAAPYFLGQALDLNIRHDEASQRGQALQQVLRQTSESLTDELKTLLGTVYFQRNPHLDNTGLALSLHMSERTFYRLRTKAIQALAQALNASLLPPLRSETPLHQVMIGRATMRSQALATLQAGRSFCISGPSGIGKTVLGAAIAREWLGLPTPGSTDITRRAFWYTLRRGFNDQINGLLFALGHFLRSMDAGHTWRQLVADRGKVDLGQIMGLVRYDLGQLQPAPPLMCVDEMNALQDEISEHVQILHLLEEMRGLCPILLIGQRVLMDTDEHVRLSGFPPDEFEVFLEHLQISMLSAEQRQQLLTHTRGTPALIVIFAALLRNGDAVSSALQALAKTPSLEGLFNRMWRRFNQDERDLLMQLAVFRHAAPQDVWQEQSALLDRLAQAGIIHEAGQGGIQVLPHLKPLIYESIPAELRPLLHLRAREIKEVRAEHLAAIYHACEGGQPAWGVWHWLEHRRREIEQGQGAAALALLRHITPTDLPTEADQTALRMARAELLELSGQLDEAEQELQATRTAPHSTSRAFVRRLQGAVFEAQGRVEQALQHYREALDVLTGLPQTHVVATHIRLSFLQLYRLHDVERARQEALLARAKADAFLGDIEAMAGHYPMALDHLLSAKNNTEAQSGDLRALSRIYSYLGVVYIKLGEFDQALHYLDQAAECDRKRGDEVGPLYDAMNRATAYTLSGRYEQGYAAARQGLVAAEKLRNAYLIAGLAACVAEACNELQRLEEAEHFASYALNQEEEFFRGSALLVLGRVRLAQGRPSESVDLLRAACENAQKIEDRYTEASIQEWLGIAYHKSGIAHTAQSTLDAAQQIYAELGLVNQAGRLQELRDTLFSSEAA